MKQGDRGAGFINPILISGHLIRSASNDPTRVWHTLIVITDQWSPHQVSWEFLLQTALHVRVYDFGPGTQGSAQHSRSSTAQGGLRVLKNTRCKGSSVLEKKITHPDTLYLFHQGIFYVLHINS